MFEKFEEAQPKASEKQGLPTSPENTSLSSSTPEQTQSKVTPEHVYQQVSEFLKTCQKDKDGKTIFPDNIDPLFAVAAKAEDRRRRTQAHITETQQENKQLKRKEKVLMDELNKHVVPTLSNDEKERLEEMKHEDPEAWRLEMNALEAKKQRSAHEAVAKRVADEQAADDARILAKMQQENARILSEWRVNHPEFASYTDEDLKKRIPPYLDEKVLKGEIEFGDALEELAWFLNAPKTTVTQSESPELVNLSKYGTYPDGLPTKDTPTEEIF